MRILIVEDSVSMRKVMQMTFAGEDAELLAVESGELALQQGRDFGPDVAFIDASLPGIDGYEVTRAIKSDPQLAGTSVILMASQHRPLDEARASEVGADGHILKPFDTQEAIDKAIELADQAEALYEAPSIPVARPATTPPRPISQPSYRPTPPPLPVSGPSSRPMAPTPLSGAQISVAPAGAASLRASAPAAKVASSPAAPLQATAAVNEALSHSVVERLETLGLTPDQVEGVLKLSAEVVERVVWEVVPDLAEAMIREELHRLVGD
ncbi:MAG: response regulator [Deltaproteobacteria bacterium]|nr:response regulator [Deltaproteobacteria bacterium]MBW1873858.1 response regulator [Deltaproteobacteria bacterium]MBW2209739.1 response regulator [Deltaproteobacteria bacterium]MBW2549523.1 response regulator [Deltaproteobacteria bacterium]MBW2626907.1 response regulator [Deltaproteobacteria bacterium]